MRDFEDGFYGNSFREFDALGVKTVRHLFETNKLPNEMTHHDAERWLGRQDAKERVKAQSRFLIPVVMSALGVSIALTSLVVSIVK